MWKSDGFKISNSAINFLEKTAVTHKDKPALYDYKSEVSFGELREYSVAAGTWLCRNTKGRNIAVLLPKSIECIISFFGVLYSGKTYVPIDYNDANDRICQIVKNSDAELVITDEKYAELFKTKGIAYVLAEDILKTAPDYGLVLACVSRVCDCDPAYIMHTSGSTGVPKGVVVSHRGVIDFTNWIDEYMHLTDEDVIGLQSPFHFDASVFDIYTCIAVGCKTVILPDSLMMFPNKIPQFIEDNKISCIFWVPEILAKIINSENIDDYKMPSLRLFTFIGEVMPTKILNMWKKHNPNREYINLYGPTEATVACTAFRIECDMDDKTMIPMGKASGNKRVFVLNEENKLAAVDEIGEICISGSGLAYGYYNRPQETADAFVQNPLTSSYRDMMYRTGDFGYVNSSGDIVFSGRKDAQVKIHGIRVELLDIETAALCVENVERACALLDDEKNVILYLQTKEQVNTRKFNLKLREYIPGYMLPKRVIAVEKFETNKNGKIDRKKLLEILRTEM